MRTRVVVLGAGFGGLELTTILSDAFGDATPLDALARIDGRRARARMQCRTGAKAVVTDRFEVSGPAELSAIDARLVSSAPLIPAGKPR